MEEETRRTLVHSLAAWALVVWLGAVAWLSLAPAPPALGALASDKLGHLLAYAVGGAIGSAAAPRGRSRRRVLIALVAFGALLELVQAALPGRSPSLGDLASNVAGVLLGRGGTCLAARVLLRRAVPPSNASR